MRARKGRFDGSAPELRPGLPSGHMPGAANLPYGELLNPDGTMLDPAALRARFEAAGVEAERPVVTSCGSGVTACILTLGAGARRLARGGRLRRLLDRMGLAARDPESDRLMPDDAPPGKRKTPPSPQHGFATRMSHAGRPGTRVHGFVNPAIHRGSTVLYPDCASRIGAAKRRFDQYLTYGTQGGPTHYALEDMMAEIEGGTRCVIVGTGLAAITVPLMAYLKAGDHCLMADSVYGPARTFCDSLLRGWGVETTYYDPAVDEAGMRALIRPNTRVVYTESPGSHSFELQDIPAIARAAHDAGAKVLMDNTWGIHHFQPFRHGVDVSIQALTKYPAGIPTSCSAAWS